MGGICTTSASIGRERTAEEQEKSRARVVSCTIDQRRESRSAAPTTSSHTHSLTSPDTLLSIHQAQERRNSHVANIHVVNPDIIVHR